MPRLSIITPSYNSAVFLPGCIQNVAAQEADCEHIIVDGGSSDDTVKILERQAARHPHLRWISEADDGQSDAMNKGIAMANAGVIGFLNVDDYYDPGVLNRVNTLFADLEAPAFVVGNCRVFTRSGRLLRVSRPVGLSAYRILAGEVEHPVNPAAYFYHKSLHEQCGPYRRDEHQLLDVDMILKLLRVAHVHYFDEDWGNWRFHGATKSAGTHREGAFDAYYTLIRKHIDLLPEPERSAATASRTRLGLLLALIWMKLVFVGELLGDGISFGLC